MTDDVYDNLDHCYYQEKNIKIYQGNILEVLKQLPSEFVDCVITSPPY